MKKMNRLLLALVVLVCLVFAVSAAQAAVTLDWTMAADPLTTWSGGPVIFPATPATAFTNLSVSGTGNGSWFTSYFAVPSLPQLTGGDLNKYAWNMNLTQVGSTVGSNASYSGTFSLYAPGYGYANVASSYLETATVSVDAVFNPLWTSAALSGSFNATPGNSQPAGWPTAVDWSAANPGSIFEGTWSFANNAASAPHVSGTDYIQARVISTSIVPEPMSVLLGLMGLGSVAGFRRFRK